jgi:hypothetical protein
MFILRDLFDPLQTAFSDTEKVQERALVTKYCHAGFVETDSWALVLLAIGVCVLFYEKNAAAADDGENGKQARQV